MIFLEICSIRHLLFKEVELKYYYVQTRTEMRTEIIFKIEIVVELKLF